MLNCFKFRGHPLARLMFFRGVLAFFAFTTYYIALSSIPLAEAAVVYMTAPLFVTLLSALAGCCRLVRR